MNEILLVIYLFVLITGACIGSFLNVVALRAMSKESIVFPASKCPVCGEAIKWYDNIPVLSYFFTFKGKCRSCGCKVSIQYPIVESITAILFLAIVMFFGIGLKTLMLLILLCISIVMMITDFKEEHIYDAHLWTFICASIAYAFLFGGNIFNVCTGILFAVITMEALARLSYYLVRKNDKKDEENNEAKNENVKEETENAETENSNTEEDIDINEYVRKYKRAFGEGDTYLAAGAGALLGIKCFIIAVALAVIIQAIFILPQFIINLYKSGEKRILFSICAFFTLSVVYWVLSNMFNLHLYAALAIIIPLMYFAFDTITRLKKTVSDNGFAAIPFGPAILTATFIMLLFTPFVTALIKKYILFMM